VTAEFDSALLLHNTPRERDDDLTNWYKYQRNAVIRHIDPEDGDGGDV
jgi:hypothetical protein